MPTHSRAAGNRKLGAAIVILLAVCAVGVWWMLRDDTGAAVARPPVAGEEIPASPKSNAPTVRPRISDPAPVTPARASEPVETDSPPVVVEAVAEGEAEEDPDGPLLSIDGERMPPSALRDALAVNKAGAEPREFAVKIAGKVTHADGRAVVGAKVRPKARFLQRGNTTLRMDSARLEYEYRRRVGDTESISTTEGVTGEDGRYELEVRGVFMRNPTPPIGRMQFGVVASAGGLLTTRFQTVAAWADGVFPAEVLDCDIVMCSPGKVSGRVRRGDNGMPVAGASVALTRVIGLESLAADQRSLGAGSQLIASYAAPVPCVFTDAEGVFSFESVADGVYQCWAVWPETLHAGWRFRYGSAPVGTDQLAEVRVSDGQAVANLELVLHQESRLLFRTDPVVEEVQGVSLLDAVGVGRMEYLKSIANARQSAERQRDGSWAVEGLLPSHRAVQVFVPGFEVASARFEPRSGRDVDAGVITLSLGWMVEGRVVDEVGRPVARATVELRLDGGGSGLGGPLPTAKHTRSTDSEGKFRFTGLADAMQCTVMARSDGMHPASARVVPKRDVPANVELVLNAASAVVAGRIEIGSGGASQGKPGRGAVVIALDATAPGVARFVSGGSLGGLAVNAPRTDFVVAEDWTFKGVVKPGKYRLFFTLGMETVIEDVEAVAHGEAFAVLRIGQSGEIRGFVFGPNGGRLAGASVTAFGPGGFLGGMMLLEGRSPSRSVTTDGNGAFEFVDIMPGTYTLWAPEYPALQHHPVRSPLSKAKVTVPSGQTVEANIDLSDGPQGAAVFLTVTLNGAPAQIFLNELALHGDARATQHAGFLLLPDGRHLAVGVPLGDHYASARAFVDAPQPTNIEERVYFTVAHGVQEVTVSHDMRTAWLSGKVEVPQGSEILHSEVRINAHQLAGRGRERIGVSQSTITPDADGTFSRYAIPLGWYQLVITAPGRAATATEVEITGDTTVALECGPMAGYLVIEYGGLEGAHPQAIIDEFKRRASATMLHATQLDGSGAIGGSGSNNFQYIEALITAGTVRTRELAPGRITVVVGHPMCETIDLVLDVPSGGEVRARVTFRLGPLLTLTLAAEQVPAGADNRFSFYMRKSGSDVNYGVVTLSKQADGSYRGSQRVRTFGDLVLVSYDGKHTPQNAAFTIERGGSLEHAIGLTVR